MVDFEFPSKYTNSQVSLHSVSYGNSLLFFGTHFLCAMSKSVMVDWKRSNTVRNYDEELVRLDGSKLD